jgi:DNA-directed RNA polymerase specialized sigma24 family protein
MKLENKAGFKCEFGCNQEYHLKKTGKYCPHLEKKIGNMRRGETRDVATLREALYSEPETPEDRMLRLEAEELDKSEPVDQEAVMRANMARLMIPEKQAEVVILRIVRGYTFQEIADELGYKNKDGAHHTYTRVIDQLKLKGYGNG